VLVSEISQLLHRRHSVVTHQLVASAPALATRASAHLAALHDALGVEPTALTWESHGVGRLVTLIPHDRHGSDLRDRVGALQLSRWGDDLRVHRWGPTLVAV
jgi:hypothetical protein